MVAKVTSDKDKEVWVAAAAAAAKAGVGCEDSLEIGTRSAELELTCFLVASLAMSASDPDSISMTSVGSRTLTLGSRRSRLTLTSGSAVSCARRFFEDFVWAWELVLIEGFLPSRRINTSAKELL